MDTKSLENIIKDALDNTNVVNLDSVYEKGKLYNKFIMSFHGLELPLVADDLEGTPLNSMSNTVLHTKLVFRLDLKEDKIKEEQASFWFLYDINCIYHKIDFDIDKPADLKDKIREVFLSNDFGKDIKNLSIFAFNAPSSSIADYLSKIGVTDLVVSEVIYNPKRVMFPCEETLFDFDITVNNISIEMSFRKKHSKKYIFLFKLPSGIYEYEEDNTEQVAQKVGNYLNTLKEKLV